MKRFLLNTNLYLFALILVLFAAGAANATPADDDYTLGLTLYGQKRWDLAIETFEDYLKKYPDHKNVPLAKVYLAQGYVNQQNYKQARVVLRDFLKKHPKNKNESQAMYRVAECSYFLEDYPAAIKEFQTFLKKSPDDPLTEWVFPYLADSYLRAGNAKQAEEVFRRSLKKFPQGRFLEDSRFGLAQSLERLNRPKEAITQYQLLIKAPQSQRVAEAMFNLGMLYFQQKEFSKTAEIFTQLVEDYPDNALVPLAQLNTGYAYYSLKKWDLAKQNFDAAAISPTYRDTARFWLAQVYKSQGDYTQAKKILQILLRDKPAENLLPRITFQLAECQLRLGKYDEASAEFLAYLKQWPKGESVGKAYVHAIEVSLLNNRPGQSWTLAEQALKAKPKLPEQLQREIKLLQARSLSIEKPSQDPLPESLKEYPQRLQRADSILTKLLKETDKKDSDVMSQQIRYQAARTKKELGAGNEAIKIIAAITTEKPEKKTLQIPEAWLLLAGCQYEARNYQAAFEASQKFLALSPDESAAKQGLIVQLNSLMELGQIKQAIPVMESLRKHQLPPAQLAQLIFQLADAAYSKKEWAQAEQLYQSLLEIAPSPQWKIKGLSAIGWTQFEAKQFDASAETFRKLKEQFPDSKQAAADAGYMRGMAKLKANQFEEAAKIFLETAETFRSQPEDKQGNEIHLIAYRSAREAARAFRRLNKVKESDKGYKIAYEELRKQPDPKKQHLDKLLDEWALLHYEAEQYEQADHIFELLVKETPQSDRADDAMLSLAESQYIAGKTDEAGKLLEQLAGNPQADQYVKRRSLYQLVMLKSEQKDFDSLKKYAELYLKTINIQKADISELGEVESQLIQFYLDANQLKQARQQLDQLMKRADALDEKQSPAWLPRSYVLAAELARREKKYDEVRSILASVKKRFANSDELAQVEVIAGRTYIAEAKFDDALKMFKSVLDRAGSKKHLAAAQSQFYIAETALMQKEYSKAVKEYIRMAVLFPGYPDLQSAAMFQAGQCDEVLKNVEQAIKSYEELIRLFPNSEFTDKAKERIEKLKSVNANK